MTVDMPEQAFRETPADHRRAWAVGIFLTALIARLLVLSQLRTLPIWRVPWLDSREYLEWARHIVMQISYWPPYPEHGPGYPYFLSVILALSGGSIVAAGVVQSLLDALSCLLTARLASDAFSPRAGVIAGFLQALYGPLILIEISLYAEGLLIFLLLAALAVALSRPRPGAARWLLCGALFGLALIVRPTGAAILPLLVAAAWRLGGEGSAAGAPRRRSRAVGLLFAAAALPVIMVLATNFGKTGSAMIQRYAGLNFYVGNNPAGNGLASARPGAEWERLESAAAASGLTRPGDQDAYYLRAALEQIRERPLGWVRVLGAKLLWLVQADEIRDSHSYYFFRTGAPLLGMLPGWVLAFPLAAIGLSCGALVPGCRPRQPDSPRWLAGVLGLMALTCVVFEIGSRYRMPLVPLVLIFAGHGAVAVIAAARTRAWGNLARLAAVGVIALLLTQARHHAESRNVAEELTFTGNSLMEEHDFAGAEAAYRSAVAADPRSDYAWDALGLALLRRERWDEARAAFERVVALAPEGAKGLFHLGFLDEQRGRAAEAVGPLRRAVALAPANLEAWRALGRALLINGQHREAGDIFRRLVRHAPNAPDVWFGLAWLAEQDGAIADGLAAARRAVELQPDNGEAWFLLGRLAILARDAATAESALARARALVPQPAPAIDASLAELKRLRAASP